MRSIQDRPTTPRVGPILCDGLPADWFAGEIACAVDAGTGAVKRLYPASSGNVG